MTRRLILLATVFLFFSMPALAQRVGAADALDRAPSRFAKLDAITIHYKSLGEGETALVFVHGWACDLTFWRFQVPAFEGDTHGAARPAGTRSERQAHENRLQPRPLTRRHAVLQQAGVKTRCSSDRALACRSSASSPSVFRERPARWLSPTGPYARWCPSVTMPSPGRNAPPFDAGFNEWSVDRAGVQAADDRHGSRLVRRPDLAGGSRDRVVQTPADATVCVRSDDCRLSSSRRSSGRRTRSRFHCW